jgi:chromosome segregation ATPase
LNSFDGAVKNLRMLTKRLDEYLSSDKPNEMEQISSKVSKLLDRIEANKAKLLELEPTLESVKRAVDDQERHKKMLKQNIDVLEAEDRMKQKQKQIESLENELLRIEGHSTVGAEYQEAKNLKGELQRKKANYDGRFSSLVEQIRALKVRRFVS